MVNKTKTNTVMDMVFYATFYNISAMSWQSALLVEKKPEDPLKTTDLTLVTDKLHLIMLYRVCHAMSESRTHSFSVDKH